MRSLRSYTNEIYPHQDALAKSITMDDGFCIKVTEVTQGEWEKMIGGNPAFFKSCGEDCPVEQVSLEDAKQFANALSRRAGLPECYQAMNSDWLHCSGYRLPTEEEWEYASAFDGRPGSSNETSDSSGEVVVRSTLPVGGQAPNRWGLRGMYGNVSEWVMRTAESRARTEEYCHQLNPPNGHEQVLCAAESDSAPETSGDAGGAREVGTGDDQRMPALFLGGSWKSNLLQQDKLPSASSQIGSPVPDIGFRVIRNAGRAPEQAMLEPAGKKTASPSECPPGFQLIKAGSFLMGSPKSEEGRDDDEVQHRVVITKSFCMKREPVTQQDWRTLTEFNPSPNSYSSMSCGVESDFLNDAVTAVSWADASNFANLMSRREGFPECYSSGRFARPDCMGYRLPTEAEWEYVAKAGARGTVAIELRAAGSKELYSETPGNCGVLNRWGVGCMLGNVWEWTNDWYGEYEDEAADPLGPASGLFKVARGGFCLGWEDGASEEEGVCRARATNRFMSAPGRGGSRIGFRLVRTLP